MLRALQLGHRLDLENLCLIWMSSEMFYRIFRIDMKIVSQSRVAGELPLVAFGRRHSNTELSGTLTPPTTRLHLLLRAPRQVQKISHAVVRIIKLRIH